MLRPSEIEDAFRAHGFVVLPGFLDRRELTVAQRELDDIYPTAAEFHEHPEEPSVAALSGDEFAGIRSFPFAGTALNLLAVREPLTALAERLLGSDDIRLYTAELRAKYTGAADYAQPLHRDYLNHTLLGPSPGKKRHQVEMFLYLDDVPEDLGPPHFLSKTVSGDPPVWPNWITEADAPEWYRQEVSAAGPAGTVVAFGTDTFHRGTALERPESRRLTMQLGFRRAAAEWGCRMGWANIAYEAAWRDFVPGASLRQLLLFGFPPPGDAYWTASTLAGLAERYPGLDVAMFRR